MGRNHRGNKSKREIATRGNRHVRHADTPVARARREQSRSESVATTSSTPIRCWEQSAFWMSVVAGVLLVTCAVAGVVGFCKYVKRDGAGGRVSTWCAAACNVCFSVGFSDWDRPLLGGLWEDVTDSVTHDDTDTTDVEKTDTETDTESESESESETASETDTLDETDSATETEGETEVETAEESTAEEPVFVGDRAVTRLDMSYADRGAWYMENHAGDAPDLEAVLAAADRLDGQTVLIVTSHPMDTYRDGGSMGELAETLADLLRARGVTAVYVSVPSFEESYLDAYYATADLLRYSLTVTPDVGLVLDLRRSGELTQDGGVLQTDGSLAGGRCAQVRFSVDGEGAYWQESLGVALRLRERLWLTEASLARPTRLRTGVGLSATADRPMAFLTVEIGALGNRYVEAERTLPALAEAVAALMTLK